MKNNQIFVIPILILSLSVAYYFVYYLPRMESKRQELEEKKLESEFIQKRYDSQQLDYCLQSAESNYMDHWNSNCESQGLEDGCSLPMEHAKSIESAREDNRELCLKKHGE